MVHWETYRCISGRRCLVTMHSLLHRGHEHLSKVRSINRRGAGSRRKRGSKRRRVRKLGSEKSSESGGRMSVLQFVIDGFGNQVFLVAQYDGVLTDRSDLEGAKGCKSGQTSHQGDKIWGQVGRVSNMDGVL